MSTIAFMGCGEKDINSLKMYEHVDSSKCCETEENSNEMSADINEQLNCNFSNDTLESTVDNYINFLSGKCDGILLLLQEHWRRDLLSEFNLTEKEFNEEFAFMLKWVSKTDNVVFLNIEWYEIISKEKLNKNEFKDGGSESEEVYKVLLRTNLGDEAIYISEVNGKWYLSEDDLCSDIKSIIKEYRENH